MITRFTSRAAFRRLFASTSHATEMIAALEPRVLLTYTINGTAGNDLITLNTGGAGYIVTLNGAQVANSADPNIILAGNGGDDYIRLYSVQSGASVTVRGGLGNDTVEVGNGSLFDYLRGHVYLEELAGQGNDQLVIEDTADTTIPDHSVRVRDNLLTTGSSSLVGVHYDDNVEIKTLNCSSAADTVNVESPASGMTINLGAGNDTVRYGSLSANNLPDFMAFGAVNGGSGFDRVTFVDSSGPSTVQRDYFIDPTRIENQTLSGVEDAELLVRWAFNGGNTVRMTGRGSTDGLLGSIKMSGIDTGLQIGTAAVPVDVSAMSLSLDVAMGHGLINIYDTKDAILVSPWNIFTTFAGQVVSRGFTSLVLRDADEAPIFINAGPTNDQFSVSQTVPGSAFYLDGGGGDDSLYTSNANFQDNDLDEVFLGFIFRFNGGPGQDYMDLDDTADEIGDGDEVYHLLGDALNKGANDLIEWGVAGGGDDDVELVRLAAGAENNTIYFRGPRRFGARVAYIIDAGAGNDYITNYIPDFGWNGGDLSWSYHDATVVGGAGNDTLAIDDTANNAASRSYHFDASYRMLAPSNITFDASIETLSLEASEGSGPIRIDAKPANMQLTVNGRGGDDVFTVGGGDIDSKGFTTSNTTLTGGGGIDSITFDDRLDDYQHAANENEIYTLENNTFRKDLGGMLYFTFEHQTIQTADVLGGSFLIDNTVNINNNSINFLSTTIIGGSVRGNGVYVSTGNITNLSGNFAFHLGTSGGNAVFLNDQNNAQPAEYSVQSTSMTRSINFANPRTIAYSGLNFLIINGGSSIDLMEFMGTPAGMISFANGNAGNDFLSVGGGPGGMAALLGRVDLDGGANVDTVYFDNGQNTAANTATLTRTTFSVNAGPVHNYANFEAANVYLGNGPTDARINGASIPTQVSGGNANDIFAVGNGDIDANISFGVTVTLSGGAGNDQIRLNDLNDTTTLFDNQYFLQVVGGADQLLRRPGTFGLQWTAASWTGMESAILDASNINSTIEVLDTLTPLRVNGNAGSDTIRVADTTASVTVNGGAGIDSLTVNSDNGPGDAPATVIIDTSDDVGFLEVKIGGTLRILPGVVLALTGPPFVSNFGAIDLAGGSLLLRAGGGGQLPSTIRNQIIAGRNGGAWNGSSANGAINSSLAAGANPTDAIGYGLGSQIAPTSIGPFAISPADTLIRYTYYGDADLNGVVNFDDYSRIDNGFLNNRTGWVNGDFDYNNVINFDDYALIDLAFNTQGAPLRPLVAGRVPAAKDTRSLALEARSI
ncbi:hypothetical protein BH09PLA1_BH09PLA1_09890 [soil metagenome]